MYERAALRPGRAQRGPALVVEPETTTVIGPGATARVDRHGNVIMKVPLGGPRHE